MESSNQKNKVQPDNDSNQSDEVVVDRKLHNSPDHLGAMAGAVDAQLYLDIAGSIFVVIDQFQRVTSINRKGCEILGYSRDEIIGQNWFEKFLPEPDKWRMAKIHRQLMNGELELATEFVENPIQKKDGQTRIIAWQNTILSDEQGRPFASLSSGIDVTEQKQAQTELEQYKTQLEEQVKNRTAELVTANKQLQQEIAERKRTEEALMESQVRFAGILDIATEAIISVNADQRIMLFNKGAENTFGYLARETIGQKLDILIPNSLVQLHQEHMTSISGTPDIARVMDNQRRILGQRKNGEVFPASSSISKLTVGDKQIFTVVLRDITEHTLMEEEREQRISELKALNEAVRSITSELSLEQVLNKIGHAARELVKVKFSALGLHDGTGKLSRFITAGIDITEHGKIGPLPVGRGLLGHLLRNGESLIVEDIAGHRASVGFPENHPHMQNLLGVPIFSKGKLIGALYLTDKVDGTEFSEADRQLVEMLAAQAAIAIENAQLYEQTQRLAVLEERERFARDLHDGIIQSIYGVGLALDQAKMDIRSTNYAAREQIELSLKSLASVIKDIRNYIFDLRPEALKYQGLNARLIGLIRELRVNTLLPIKAEISPNIDASLTETQSRHIFHITHEALSNAARHANASQILLRIHRDDQNKKITVVVEDDGVGFEYPADSSPGHRGLSNIQSRAAQLNSGFQIHTAPNEGTRLVLDFEYDGNNQVR
jgi:PAS domain S-box-containing protein